MTEPMTGAAMILSIFRARRRPAPALLAALLLLLSGSSCSRGSSSESRGSEDGKTPVPIVEVTLTNVVRSDISEILPLSGTVSAPPNKDVRVSAQVAGRVAELKVAEGDRVQAGQLLARIDARPYHDQLVQAEGAISQARANLQNATLSRARNEDLLQRGIAARKEVEDARTQESVAKAALQQAEGALSLVKLQVARTALTAPFPGVVVKRFVNVGEQVDGTAGQPVIEVANLSQVELLVNVPGAYLPQFSAGRSIDLSSEAFPDQSFIGRVLTLPAAVDPATGAGTVRIGISNPKRLLRLGMFLTAQVPLVTHRGALVIPAPALYHNEDNQPLVYQVEGETAASVQVKPGIITRDRIEITEGLKEGETLILSGGYGLGDKAHIKVKGSTQP